MPDWYGTPLEHRIFWEEEEKEKGKEENLKRLPFEMRMTQVFRIGTTKCSALWGDGILRGKFNFSRRQRKFYPWTSGLLYCTYFDYSSSNSKLHVFCVIYAFNCANYKLWKRERETYFLIVVWGFTHHSTQWVYVPPLCELTCVNKPLPSSDQFLRASHRVKISPNWTRFYCWRNLTFKIQNAS